MQQARRSGQSLIELTAGLMVLVPVILFLVDFAFILWGVQSNDLVCRDAARAAAAGDPADATARAEAVVSSTGERNSSVITSSILIPPVEVYVTQEPVRQFDRTTHQEYSPGGSVSGTVKVSTEVEITPFVLKMLLAGQRKLTFQSHQSFPITYIMPVVAPPERAANPDDD